MNLPDRVRMLLARRGARALVTKRALSWLKQNRPAEDHLGAAAALIGHYADEELGRSLAERPTLILDPELVPAGDPGVGLVQVRADRRTAGCDEYEARVAAATVTIAEELDRLARVATEPGGDVKAERAARLPELKAHDRQAWQLATLHGWTQDKVAGALNKEHGTTYGQGQVSRMIARAKAHADANGLAEKVAGPIDRPRTVDPGRLELGARVDKRKPRQSDSERSEADG